MRMTESDSHFCTTLMSDREEPLETNWRVIESGMDDEAHTHTPPQAILLQTEHF